MTSKSFERKVNPKVVFNTKVENWVDIFARYNITDTRVQKIFKSLSDSITWFGANLDIPMINANSLRKSVFAVCEFDPNSALIFSEITNGIINFKKGLHKNNVITSTADQVNEAIYAFYLSKKHSNELFNVVDKLNDKQKLEATRISLEYFGKESYLNMKSLGMTPPNESILAWCWDLNANKKNNYIEILNLPEVKEKGISEKIFMSFFKLNFLLKKTTEYIETNWLDFSKVMVARERFYEPTMMPNTPKEVPLKELKSLMHFKTKLDDLSRSRSYLTWEDDVKGLVKNKDQSPYIDYKKHTSLQDLIKDSDLPSWSLDYVIKFSDNSLSKSDHSENQKKLFTDTKILIYKLILENTLSANGCSKKNFKI